MSEETQLAAIAEILKKDGQRDRNIFYWVLGLMIIMAMIIAPPTWSMFITMTDAMDSMKTNMSKMETHMLAMTKDIQSMRVQMENMNKNIASMAGDIHIMKDDMSSMSGNMGTMQQHVGVMTGAVNNMSVDTRQMGNTSTWYNPRRWMPW